MINKKENHDTLDILTVFGSFFFCLLFFFFFTSFYDFARTAFLTKYLGQYSFHCFYDLQVKVPLYGCDCYAYALLASGFVDLVIESGLKVSCIHFCFTLLILHSFSYISVLVKDK